MKILRWTFNHLFLILTLFLLAFIPLYPKLPFLDIKNTWVYVRVEDLVVVAAVIFWVYYFLKHKVTLTTPLTLPILMFWLAGAVATLHGILLIFPTIPNVFPNVAFLSFLRRIEYLSLFFIAFSGTKDKKSLTWVIAIITFTLLAISLYGIGQKYFGFPAFLTMNEEFAKGTPIKLSALSRIPSTFGGHYDLAAYLVLVIPILVSLIFAFQNLFVRLLLLSSVGLAFLVLVWTVSRVSIMALIISLFLVLLFQKRKFVALVFPLVAVVAAVFVVRFAPALFNRVGSTIQEAKVLIEAKSGRVLGTLKDAPKTSYLGSNAKTYFFVRNEIESHLTASPSAYIPYDLLPVELPMVTTKTVSTGENLPQGTSYINLTLSPVTRRLGLVFYELPENYASGSARLAGFWGDFLEKKASAYDLSFTTRFQGEWPNALKAFRRNIFFGSGYGAISLAVDNDYLRTLGEVGVIGFIASLLIFVSIGIYIVRVLPQVDSALVKSFVLGYVASVAGLLFNALLIDVFEASKVAFSLWLITGVTFGILQIYQKKPISLLDELKRVAVSPYAIIIYLLVFTILIYSPMIANHFVGDDFTWFQWAKECPNVTKCDTISKLVNYFTQAKGFFYRPGTKVYFWLMYSLFWLNPTVYHLVSIFLHFLVAVLVFLIAAKIFRFNGLAALAAFTFLVLSGYSEAVFWISATGFLFTALFSLVALYSFILWREKNKKFYLTLSFISIVLGLLFHELGVITPLLMVAYAKLYREPFAAGRESVKRYLAVLFLPMLPYFILRLVSQSHWFSGDYSYNLLKLPLNIAGNIFGYGLLALMGPLVSPTYSTLRNFSRENLLFAIIAMTVIVMIIAYLYNIVLKMANEEKKIIFFAGLFFLIALLPFLGLGNITSRYSYLASVGAVFLLVFFLKRCWEYLQDSGKDIAIIAGATIISVFFLLQVIQIQQIHSNWHEAGEKTKRLFTSIELVYDDRWTKEPMKFYFVNVPIRIGEAWVFPVGLADGLKLSFENPNITVYQMKSLEEAMDAASVSGNEKIFEFDQSGKVIERKKEVKSQ